MKHIPHIIHRYWADDSEMPEQFRLWGDRWRHLHPHWLIIDWHDALARREIGIASEELGVDLARCWHRAANVTQKSDVLRYCLVWRFGGVWTDVDFRPIKAIDDLCKCSAFTVTAASNGRQASGFFGAAAGHPFIGQILREFVVVFDPERQLATGPPLISRISLTCGAVRKYEQAVAFPFEYQDRDQLDTTTEYDGAYCVHHFHGAWIKQREAEANQ